jgi:hypothetical protein
MNHKQAILRRTLQQLHQQMSEFPTSEQEEEPCPLECSCSWLDITAYQLQLVKIELTPEEDCRSFTDVASISWKQ